MRILYVVRRFGPVGGMERYVWEVVHQLAALGHQVEVVCERCHVEQPENIKVFELGVIAPRPRWLSLLRFSSRVSHWLIQHPRDGWIIHSHERLAIHHVTTFHGPPFATIFEKPFHRLISLRVWMQLFLERRELRRAQFIVPNSVTIAKQLAHYYPDIAVKLCPPITPGVTPFVAGDWQQASAQGGIIGFVGKEWQRKGLPQAVNIVAELRRSRPEAELWVVGPEADQIKTLFANWRDGAYTLLGWSTQSHYVDFDVLLHPAKAEPYGMVISEAMAAQVPVVVSDVCGAAAQVNRNSGAVLALTDSVQDWAQAVETQLHRSSPPPVFTRNWREVAQEYETIYQQYLNAIQYE